MTQNKEFVCSFNLENNPVPHRTPTVTRFGNVYKGKRELAYIKDLSAKIDDFLKDEDLPIFDDVPVEVSYEFGFMPAKSWTKKRKIIAFLQKWMFSKPDISNIIKSTDDILMKSKVFSDDQYIVSYRDVRKVYTEKPSIRIIVREIKLEENQTIN